MRIESRVFSLSWVPSDLVTGDARLPFAMSMAPADSPPPALVTHPHSLVRDGRVRQANALRAWVEFDEQGRPADFDYEISDPDFLAYIWKPLSFEFPELRLAPQVEGQPKVAGSGGEGKHDAERSVLAGAQQGAKLHAEGLGVAPQKARK